MINLRNAAKVGYVVGWFDTVCLISGSGLATVFLVGIPIVNVAVENFTMTVYALSL